MNSEKLTFNEEIKKVIKAFQIQHELLTRKLSTLDDLAGADEETRAKRKLLVTKALSLLDEVDKFLKEGQERMEKQERESEIRMRRMETDSLLRKANPSYSSNSATSTSSSSSSSSTPAPKSTESEEEKEKEREGGEEKGATGISEAGLNFIARHESCFLSVYKDPVGIPTIGYGHKIEKGEVFDRELNPEEAWELLRNDTENRAAKFVRYYVKVRLNQHQFDALTSFTFNLGCGNFSRSTLLTNVNNEEYKKGEEGREKVRREFLEHSSAKNKETGEKIRLKGLELRREREARLFLDGVYNW